MERTPNTARRNLIRLTEYETAFVARYITPLRDAERKTFSTLRSDERRIFVETSERYAKNLNAEIERLLIANEKQKSNSILTGKKET